MESVFNFEYDLVFDNCLKVLKLLEMVIEHKDKKTGIINTSTKTSFRSYGEDIEIKFIKASNKTKVIVRSIAKSQLFTWGKNYNNEINIIEKMTHILSN
jgi:hypothetical protein